MSDRFGITLDKFAAREVIRKRPERVTDFFESMNDRLRLLEEQILSADYTSPNIIPDLIAAQAMRSLIVNILRYHLPIIIQSEKED